MSCTRTNFFKFNRLSSNFLILKNRFITSSFDYQNKQNVVSKLSKRVCIVGAGPAGFYAAQYLLKQLKDCEVDIIEKLPVPFGLVRFGVAPDHQEVKNVINTFTKTAENPRFRFFGNVNLGKDVSLQELRERYHAVLLAYGADRDRELQIPNEAQSNIISARNLVAWYNGLPGSKHLQLDLSGENVTIIGQGNVAIDVARMLLSPIDTLKCTDITEHALATLATSKVRRVFLVGRRGPLQAAFTIKELREMLRLPNVQTIWRPEDFMDIPQQLDKLQRPRKRLTELMLKSLNEQSRIPGNKQFVPVFLRAPKSIGDKYIEFAITKLQENTAIATTKTEQLPADLLLRSIGYKSSCVDSQICFDQEYGHVLNENGRVFKDNSKQTIDIGLYTAGWLGTGPTGVILTTMNNAFAVAKTICEDFNSNILNATTNKAGFETKGKRVVSWAGWQRIDRKEIDKGKTLGKPREKLVSIEEMLEVANI